LGGWAQGHGRLGWENCEAIPVDRGEVVLIRQAEVEAWLDNAGPDA